MLWLGIDDTDTLDSPGTNKLALHLARTLVPRFVARLVTRHQLFFDPRVPYTSHNGSVSLILEPALGESAASLIAEIRPVIRDWSPAGSDPAICVASLVSEAITNYGLRCQSEVITQAEAHELAARHGLHLESIAGSGDGVIGALAAVGLVASQNDGRVLHPGARDGDAEPFDIKGSLSVAEILRRGVSSVRHIDTGEAVERGTVALSKRLRPNLRHGELILFVQPALEAAESASWQAVKVT